MSALLALGVIVALSIVLAAFWYKASTNLKILNLAVAPNGGLVILAEVPDADPSKLYGKKLIAYTKSLGRIYSSVCSITEPPSGLGVVVASAGGAYVGTTPYVFDPSDYIIISAI